MAAESIAAPQNQATGLNRVDVIDKPLGGEDHERKPP